MKTALIVGNLVASLFNFFMASVNFELDKPGRMVLNGTIAVGNFITASLLLSL